MVFKKINKKVSKHLTHSLSNDQLRNLLYQSGSILPSLKLFSQTPHNRVKSQHVVNFAQQP